MTRDDFCNSIKKRFPAIAEKANLEYARLWDDHIDELYSYSWFEALANALNKEMLKGTPASEYAELFEFIRHSFHTGDDEIKEAIDVAFVENMFWQVPEKKAKSYWHGFPAVLKDLYVSFHHRTPL